jgi:SNF2 family DNA or RNA helicase
MRAVMSSIPGRSWDKVFNKLKPHWTYPATPAVAWKLARALKCDIAINSVEPPPGIVVCQDLLDKALRFHQAQEFKAGNLAAAKAPAGRVSHMKHQERGLVLAKYLDAMLLAWDMGTGKTKTGADLISYVAKAKRSLVVCPSKVINNWPGQWKRFGDPSIVVLPLELASIKDRAKAIESYIAMNVPFVAVINYEVVWRDPVASVLLSTVWDVVIADEIHRIKDPDGAASKFMSKLTTKSRRRIGLTGTPLPNTPLDIFAQYRFLDPGIFGNNYFAFRERYGIKGGFQNKQVVAFRNLEELNRQLYLIADKVDANEVLSLPGHQHIFKMVSLEPEARKLYEQIKGDFITEIKGDFITEIKEGSKVTLSNALTEIIRLQQITGGTIADDDGNLHRVSSAKAEAFQEFLEDLPKHENIVVFAKYHPDLNMIHEAAKKAGRKAEELSGRSSGDMKALGISPVSWEVIDGVKMTKWTPKEPGTVLVVQIQAGGVGVDFTAARYATYYSQTYSAGDYLQSLARTLRNGQERNCFFVHFVVEKSIDEKVYKALARKENVSKMVLSEIYGDEPETDFDQVIEELQNQADFLASGATVDQQTQADLADAFSVFQRKG